MHEHLYFDEFCPGIKAITKNQIIQNLAWKVGRLTPVDMTWLSEQLLLNEKKESSGIGNGVAIPHLKSTPLQKPFLMMAKLETPVDFASIDGAPVDLICVVLSPATASMNHLPLLSKVTRLLREQSILDALRKAETRDEMEIILNPQAPNILAA